MMTSHRERGRAFAEQEISASAARRDREARWDGDLFRRMGSAGLLGAGVPRAHGGGELSAQEVSELLSGFGEGSGDAGLSLAWVAHLTGCLVPIQRFGTEAQRRRYLPPLARGEQTGALCHTESAAAGDPVGVRARAAPRAGGWVIDGRKSWVVNGPVADVMIVTAVTDPRRGKDGISTFIVDRGARGVQIGRRVETSGLRAAMISEVIFDGCEVPAEGLLGAEGTGLSHALRLVRRWERACLFAPWSGLLASLLAAGVAHARERIRLGKPLAASQSIRAALADMKIRHELCLRVQARAAFQLDSGDHAADRDIAAARLFLAESAAQVTRDAVKIMGAQGAETGTLAERLHRDAAAMAHLTEEADLLRSVIAGSLLHLG